MTAATETQQPVPSVPKSARWATAVPSRRNAARCLPQAIAHRGCKASWPENTMGAFRGAVEAGAHAIETDTHLSRDGVVVLSHDASLKRCYGVDRNISDCSWEFLATLLTLREPRQPLPRLRDLLEYLASGRPDVAKMWLLLDLQFRSPPDELLSAIARTLAQVPSAVPWDDRIVLGCWNAPFLKAALAHLPGFALTHISFSPAYSWHFLSAIPNLGCNMYQRFLVGPWGAWLLRDAKRAGRPVFAWTVNTEEWMEWCLRKNCPPPPSSSSSPKRRDRAAKDAVVIDAVVTDDPSLFLEVCQRFEDELDGNASSALPPRNRPGPVGRFKAQAKTLLELLVFNVLGTGAFVLLRGLGQLGKLDAKFLKSVSQVQS